MFTRARRTRGQRVGVGKEAAFDRQPLEDRNDTRGANGKDYITRWAQPQGPTNYQEARSVVNSCVYKGFACGRNLDLPASILGEPVTGVAPSPWGIQYTPKCTELVDGLIFINATPSCHEQLAEELRRWNLYIVAHAGDYGSFFEAVDPQTVPGTFQAFKQRILAANVGRPNNVASWYVNSRNERIDFLNTHGLDQFEWGIRAVDGRPIASTNISQWPFLAGDILQASRDGLVRIRNARTNSTVTLDLRNHRAPIRTLDEDYPPTLEIARIDALKGQTRPARSVIHATDQRNNIDWNRFSIVKPPVLGNASYFWEGGLPYVGYLPNPFERGADRFEVELCDKANLCVRKTVEVTITGAEDDKRGLMSSGSGSWSARVSVLNNDDDPHT